MKILAISMGRHDHNCDIVAKHTLMAAKELDAEVKFVNTMDMKINHCTGCGACSALRDRGKQIKCVIKDDYLELENDVLDADGIILVAPVYSLAPSGQLKNFIDRFGAAHDLSAATEEQKKRIEAKAEELLDERLFKERYVAYISVGGAHTPNWVSMGLPNMYMFGMSVCMNVVGQLDAYDMGHRTNPLLDAGFLKEVSDLGKHLVNSVGKKREEITWVGDEGVCPVCHNKFISIGDTTQVECPICGILGELSIQNGKINVEFSEQEQQRARNTMNGLYEHYYELKDMMAVIIPKLQANKNVLPELMKPYKEFESTY
jgi:multimeric flavodoxin WrbA